MIDFKPLQAMQAKLDEAILQAKPSMTAEERFTKTLVALSVELAEVANCAEHFKFWKDNKGKVDSEKFYIRKAYESGEKFEYGYADLSNYELLTHEQAHHLSLVEECSDCLHFILSLANQLEWQEIGVKEVLPGETIENYYISFQWQIGLLSAKRTIKNIRALTSLYFKYIDLLGITTEELEQAHYEKNKINYERLESGY